MVSSNLNNNSISQREARRKLHKELIDEQDRPCAKCGSKDNREIHRIVPGCRGGRYIKKNCQVLCFGCHRNGEHRQSKFEVGDKVQVNGRCPNHILKHIRHNRVRTIVGVSYDPQKQCCYYILGTNRWENSMDNDWVYFFRSYQLHRPINGRKPGRPREKRRYNLHSKCTASPPNQREFAQRSNCVA